MVGRGRSVAVVILLVLGTLIAVGGAARHSSWWDSPPPVGPQFAVTLLDTRLDVPTQYMAAANGPDGAFLFGGASWQEQVEGNGTKTVLRTSDAVYGFDVATETLTELPVRLPEPRSLAAAVYAAGAYYVIGGSDGEPRDTIFRFDAKNGTFSTLPARLPTPRYGAAAAVVDDTVWLFGGKTPGNVKTNEVLRFDAGTGTVAVNDRPLAYPVANAAALYHDGLIHVMGGEPSPYGKTAVLDPTTGSMAPGGNFVGLGGYVAHATVSHGMIYFVAGKPHRDQVHVLDPARNTFLTIGQLSQPVAGAGAIRAGDVMYLVGGLVTETPWTWESPYMMTDQVLRFEGFAAPPRPVFSDSGPHECYSGGATVALDGSASEDANGDRLYHQWQTSVNLDSDHAPISNGWFPLGRTDVAMTVSDGLFRRTVSDQVDVVDTKPPFLSITRPRPGTVYVGDDGAFPNPVATTIAIGPLTVRADAGDACGLESVSFELSTGEKATRSGPPFSATFNPPPYRAGAVVLTVTALDIAGHMTVKAFEYEHIGTGMS